MLMRGKILRRVLAMFLGAAAVSCGGTLAAPGERDHTFVVTGDVVNLRAAPSLNARVVGTLQRGSRVRIGTFQHPGKDLQFESGDQWLRGIWLPVVPASGKQAWMFSTYVGLKIGTTDLIGYTTYTNGSVVQAELNFIMPDGILSSRDGSHGPPDRKGLNTNRPMLLLDNLGTPIGQVTAPKFSETNSQFEAYACTESYFATGTMQRDSNSPLRSDPDLGFQGPLNPRVPGYRPGSLAMDQIHEAVKRVNAVYFRDKKMKPETQLQCSGCASAILDHAEKKQRLLLLTLGNRNGSANSFSIHAVDSSGMADLLVRFNSSSGDAREVERFYAITDLDGNGRPEIWTKIIGYEWWFYRVYVFQDGVAVPVFSGGGGGC